MLHFTVSASAAAVIMLTMHYFTLSFSLVSNVAAGWGVGTVVWDPKANGRANTSTCNGPLSMKQKLHVCLSNYLIGQKEIWLYGYPYATILGPD